MSKIACDIVTGFLGSGKTSMLKHVLAHGLQGKKVAVIMNEIGDVGIDGKVLTGFSAVEKMVEVDSGCICCSVSLQFTVAIHEIVEAVNPTLIILETTGAADPRPLITQAMNAGLSIDAVIAVVDAADVLTLEKRATVVRTQVEAADFVVINKTDLVDAKQLKQVHNWVRKRNDRALRFETVRGAVPTDLLFGTSVGRFREEALAAAEGRHDGGTDHQHASHGGTSHLEVDGITAFVYHTLQHLDRKKFEKLLRGLPEDIYRSKGVVQFAGARAPLLFNYTCGRYDFADFPTELAAPGRTQAVFIGRDSAKHRVKIEKKLADCEVRA